METPPSVVMAAAAFCVYLALFKGRSSHPLHLVSDDNGNEAMVVEASFPGTANLFLLDLAYAGPPVLSTSYLASSYRRCLPLRVRSGRDGVERRYREAIRSMQQVTDDDRHAAVRQLMQGEPCRSYTSGCTMRLMSIGAISESQSDMLLCPALGGGVAPSLAVPGADIVVTNPLAGNVHILTMDAILHRAPVLICPGLGRIVYRAPLASGFETFPVESVGGSYSIPLHLGGARLQVVVDTGASASLSISASALARLASCSRGEQRHVTQLGVNGERVCSDLYQAELSIGSVDLGMVDFFVNDHDISGTDGYVGMGLLRAFDMLVDHSVLGLRPSGLPISAVSASAKGSCSRSTPSCLVNEEEEAVLVERTPT